MRKSVGVLREAVAGGGSGEQGGGNKEDGEKATSDTRAPAPDGSDSAAASLAFYSTRWADRTIMLKRLRSVSLLPKVQVIEREYLVHYVPVKGDVAYVVNCDC